MANSGKTLEPRRVVVTGVGAITSQGPTAQALWERYFEQLVRPVEISVLIKTCLKLNYTSDLLATFCSCYQPTDERSVVTHSIYSHLDTERDWITGAFPDEAFHAGIEAFVWKVHKHVATLDHVAEGYILVPQRRRYPRRPGRIAQVGQINAGQRPKGIKIKRPRQVVGFLLGKLQKGQQDFP